MKKILQNELDAIAQTAQVLLEGGVVILPTETVYGIATLWNNPSGRERIYEIKNRPANKLLQMLAVSIPMARQAGLMDSKKLQRLHDKYWPGALTVVAPAINGETIGLRIPNHPFLTALLQHLNQPLAATSANLSGLPAAMTAEDAVKDLKQLPDLLVDGGPIIHSGGASTVVSIVADELVVLRQGELNVSLD